MSIYITSSEELKYKKNLFKLINIAIINFEHYFF